MGMRRTTSPNGLLEVRVGRVTPASTTWFLDSCILPIVATETYKAFLIQVTYYILEYVGIILKKNLS